MGFVASHSRLLLLALVDSAEVCAEAIQCCRCVRKEELERELRD